VELILTPKNSKMKQKSECRVGEAVPPPAAPKSHRQGLI